MSKISVIMPTYNHAQYIRAAIASVLAQSERDFEIIVVDDGSTDDTETVVAEFRERLTFLQQPHSGLPAVGRNAGLRIATGEYITFLDSDDVWLPDKLAFESARLDAQPALGLVYSDAEYFRDDGSVVGNILDDLPPFMGCIFIPLVATNFIATCSMMLRRNCLAVTGFFDESPDIRGVEDYDLWLRIAARFEIGLVKQVSSRIRVHLQNISGGDKIPQYLGMLNVFAKIARWYPDWLAGHQQLWRERHALLHLAAARAYTHRHTYARALVHFAQSIRVNPDPRWLAYLATTPRPAQAWLKRTLNQLA